MCCCWIRIFIIIIDSRFWKLVYIATFPNNIYIYIYKKNMLLGFPDLTIIVLKSPSKKLRKGVRKLMAELWINSRSAPPIWFSVSPHFIRAFPVDRHRPNQYFNKIMKCLEAILLTVNGLSRLIYRLLVLYWLFTFKQGEMGHWHTAIDYYYWMRYYG